MILHPSRFNVFDNVSPELVEKINAAAKVIDLAKDEVLYQQNDPADDLYFMTRGRAYLQLSDEAGATVILGVIKTGYCFGWSALEPGQTHRQTVVSAEISQVAAVSGETIRDIIMSDNCRGLPFLWNLFHLIKDRHDLRVQQVFKAIITHPILDSVSL
jgi:CRP-like cAMP-binding protein